MAENSEKQAAGGTEINDPRPVTPLQPVQMSLDDKFKFRCHKGIPCFNQCCKNIDIMLAPYDVLRLKRRLDLSSREFIDGYTRDYKMDSHGMPGLKLATKADSQECTFLTPEGCGVYEDRPSACRYYALGLLAMRKTESPTDEDSYFVVNEDHCLGHFEPKEQTVRDYRREQGIESYDDANREWRQIVLKKRSAGPTIGSPSARSFEMFFLASYDLDGFRAFVASSGFDELFELDPALKREILGDDEKLLAFAFRFLKQVLFGEFSIPVRKDVADRRREQLKRKLQRVEEEAMQRRMADEDVKYEDLE
jgi:Fe-S-cluster containining protein